MVDRYNSRGICKNNNILGNMSRNSSCDGNSSCGNNSCNNDSNDCRKLRQRLQSIDFSIIDTVLYLDAYPNCAEALNYYHKLKNERKVIVETLAQKCNMPVTSFENASKEHWNWTDAPWPWELSAN